MRKKVPEGLRYHVKTLEAPCHIGYFPEHEEIADHPRKRHDHDKIKDHPYIQGPVLIEPHQDSPAAVDYHKEHERECQDRSIKDDPDG